MFFFAQVHGKDLEQDGDVQHQAAVLCRATPCQHPWIS